MAAAATSPSTQQLAGRMGEQGALGRQGVLPTLHPRGGLSLMTPLPMCMHHHGESSSCEVVFLPIGFSWAAMGVASTPPLPGVHPVSSVVYPQTLSVLSLAAVAGCSRRAASRQWAPGFALHSTGSSGTTATGNWFSEVLTLLCVRAVIHVDMCPQGGCSRRAPCVFIPGGGSAALSTTSHTAVVLLALPIWRQLPSFSATRYRAPLPARTIASSNCCDTLLHVFDCLLAPCHLYAALPYNHTSWSLT
jgi:hypothetical protein